MKASTAAWLALMLAGVSCKATQERPWRELTIELSWLHQAQFTGLYYAQHHGLYAKERLRVGFAPASMDRDPVNDLLDGKHDFVIAQPEALIEARASGHPVKAVAAVFRIHPRVFISLESSGIATPQDFRGKTLGVSYADRLMLGTLLAKLDIDPEAVTLVKRGRNLDSLRRGDVDVQSGWVSNELLVAQRSGIEVNVVSPYDYGVTFYADVLATRESLIQQEPELVQRFVRATMRGWAESLQDPEESGKLPLRHDPSLDLMHQIEMLKASAPLIHTGVDRLGWMREADWDAMIRALHEQGVIAKRMPAEELYTNRFLTGP